MAATRDGDDGPTWRMTLDLGRNQLTDPPTEAVGEVDQRLQVRAFAAFYARDAGAAQIWPTELFLGEAGAFAQLTNARAQQHQGPTAGSRVSAPSGRHARSLWMASDGCVAPWLWASARPVVVSCAKCREAGRATVVAAVSKPTRASDVFEAKRGRSSREAAGSHLTHPDDAAVGRDLVVIFRWRSSAPLPAQPEADWPRAHARVARPRLKPSFGVRLKRPLLSGIARVCRCCADLSVNAGNNASGMTLHQRRIALAGRDDFRRRDGVARVGGMTAKKVKATEAPVEDSRPWDKLLAAQEAFEEAEREYGQSHDWLSPRQKYKTLDRIDETMEELVHDMRNAPGLSVVPPLPDLTSTAKLLLTELRGRLMRRLNLEGADREMRDRLGLDR